MPVETLLNSIDNYLEIMICKRGVRYTVLDEQRNELLKQEINVSTESVSNHQLIDFLLHQPDMLLSENHTTIVFESTPYMLVPNELFRQEDAKILFEIEHGVNEQRDCLFYPIPKWGVHFVFALPRTLQMAFDSKYPHAIIKHRVGEWLKMKITKEDGCYLFVREGEIDVVVIKDETLELVSSYETCSVEDICYYVLQAYEQLLLERMYFPLQIFESKSLKDNVITQLKAYVLNVSVVK